MKMLLLLACFGHDLRDLGSDDFTTREAAEARLNRLADLAWPVLALPCQDLEIRRRCRRILARTLPSCYPPLALLSGKPQLEWESYDPSDSYRSVIGPCPGPGWALAWQRPDPRAPLAWLIGHYGERARNQWVWRDWHSDADGREATRLLCRDLLAVGVPVPLVRWLVEGLAERERALTKGGQP